jgi:hypothetical protein
MLILPCFVGTLLLVLGLVVPGDCLLGWFSRGFNLSLSETFLNT